MTKEELKQDTYQRGKIVELVGANDNLKKELAQAKAATKDQSLLVNKELETQLQEMRRRAVEAEQAIEAAEHTANSKEAALVELGKSNADLEYQLHAMEEQLTLVRSLNKELGDERDKWKRQAEDESLKDVRKRLFKKSEELRLAEVEIGKLKAEANTFTRRSTYLIRKQSETNVALELAMKQIAMLEEKAKGVVEAPPTIEVFNDVKPPEPVLDVPQPEVSPAQLEEHASDQQ